MEDGRTASALPCNMALASSFDRELAEEYGKVIAEECIENGIQIIFGPGINLMRTPMNGRNFEYVGEDYDADMEKMAADPVTQDWWKCTHPCFETYAMDPDSEFYHDMKSIFYHP